MSSTPLLDRIKQGPRREVSVRYLHPTEPVRLVRWIERKNAQGLPNKDYTNGQYIPAGSERGA